MKGHPGDLRIKKCEDFDISGDGSCKFWEATDWVTLTQREDTHPGFLTRVKIMYSSTGIYYLFDCEDGTLTATKKGDFLNLWEEDVVEIFLWPDETRPVYFEYELSPLNFELSLMISNDKGDLARWRPFLYEDEGRRTRRATSTRGGEKESNAKIEGWMAEFFIPFELLKPLNYTRPLKGTSWRTNLYRVDYDNGFSSWSWKSVDKSFHEYEKFGRMIFL